MVTRPHTRHTLVPHTHAYTPDSAKRPYADRLRECEEALAKHYAEMDTLLATRGPASDVARVTKAIVGEVKCEAGIARELAADPAYADRAAGFNNVCTLLLCCCCGSSSTHVTVLFVDKQ